MGTARITVVIPNRLVVDTQVRASVEQALVEDIRTVRQRDLPFYIDQEVGIYALVDPNTSQIRYIGQSYSPHARRTQHCTMALREKGRKARWLNELRKKKSRPVVCILERVPHEQANDAENKWISWCVQEGMPLLNGVATTHRVDVVLDMETTQALLRVGELFDRDPSRSLKKHLEDVIISLIYEADEQRANDANQTK